MFSGATIRAMSDRAAREAARAHRAPCVLYSAATVAQDIVGLPFLGDYCPKSWTPLFWKDVGATGAGSGYSLRASADPEDEVQLFVDSSGFGSETEPAMTRRQTERLLAAILESVQGTGWTLGAAVSEAGQFQCYIRLYRRLPRGSK